MANPPTLILIPGSWHQAHCYEKITKILEQRYKLKCISITLPSTTNNPKATFKDDVDAARVAVESETSSGNDVVVVAHSYGGMVGNSVIKGYARPRSIGAHGSTVPESSVVTTRAGHVIGLILIASGFTMTGVAFMDPFFGHPPPYWRVNKETGYAEFVDSPRELFYHDMPTDEGEYWVSQLTTQSLKALFEGGEYAYAGWQDVPTWYIGTIEDRGIPVVVQRIAVSAARAMGGEVEHRELPTSHSPFLSRPEETVTIMLEALKAFTGEPVQDQPVARTRPGNVITSPAVRLWQPLTWYRFGLPAFFGRLLGRCIIIFDWSKRLWRGRQ